MLNCRDLFRLVFNFVVYGAEIWLVALTVHRVFFMYFYVFYVQERLLVPVGLDA